MDAELELSETGIYQTYEQTRQFRTDSFTHIL